MGSTLVGRLGAPGLRRAHPGDDARTEFRTLPRTFAPTVRMGSERGAGRLPIGDCYAPRYLMNAIFDGHRLAREFESPHPQYPLPFIRERQIWGQETYPKLGDARPS